MALLDSFFIYAVGLYYDKQLGNLIMRGRYKKDGNTFEIYADKGDLVFGISHLGTVRVKPEHLYAVYSFHENVLSDKAAPLFKTPGTSFVSAHPDVVITGTGDRTLTLRYPLNEDDRRITQYIFKEAGKECVVTFSVTEKRGVAWLINKMIDSLFTK